MWNIFKLASWKAKLGILGGVLLFLVVLGGAGYLIGYNKGTAYSRIEIAKYEREIERLDAQLAKKQVITNTKVVTKYVTVAKEIEKVVYRNRDIIRNVVPDKFYLTKGWIYAYNQSIAGLPIDPVLAADGTDSGIIDSVGLERINDNNGVCLSNDNQLESIQEWIRRTKKNYEDLDS